MAQTGIADAYLASGWCARCGCKRSAEGECPNCDRWFTHPLLTVGGPLACSLLILLLVGIRSLREADPGFARFQSGLTYAAPMPAYSDPTPVRTSQPPAPQYFKPANSGTVMAVPQEIPRAEIQLANLENLRDTVHRAERGYRTGEFSQDGTKAVSSTPTDMQRSQSARSSITL